MSDLKEAESSCQNNLQMAFVMSTWQIADIFGLEQGVSLFCGRGGHFSFRVFVVFRGFVLQKTCFWFWGLLFR